MSGDPPSSDEVARAVAADRQHWAAVLHDGAVQKLTVAALRAGLLRRHDVDAELAEEIEQLEAVLSASAAALREVLADLSAPVTDRPEPTGDPTDR